jgi:hypothetical protein
MGSQVLVSSPLASMRFLPAATLISLPRSTHEPTSRIAGTARPRSNSLWGAASIGLEANGLDPVHGERFVNLTCCTGHTHGADRNTVGIADEDTAEYRDEPAGRGTLDTDKPALPTLDLVA